MKVNKELLSETLTYFINNKRKEKNKIDFMNNNDIDLMNE